MAVELPSHLDYPARLGDLHGTVEGVLGLYTLPAGAKDALQRALDREAEKAAAAHEFYRIRHEGNQRALELALIHLKESA